MNKNASPNRRPVRPIALLLALLLAGSMTGCAFRLGRQATVSPAEQPKAAIEDTPQNISPSGSAEDAAEDASQPETPTEIGTSAEPLRPVLLTEEYTTRREPSSEAALCDNRPLQTGEYVDVLAEQEVGGQTWYQVRCTLFDVPADDTGWVPAKVTVLYTADRLTECTAPLYLLPSETYWDSTGEHMLDHGEMRTQLRLTGYDEASGRYTLSSPGGIAIEVDGLAALQYPAFAPDGPLSDEELQWFRDNVLDGHSLRSMMLTSTYTDARDVDLALLFYNGIPGTENPVTPEERAALAELDSLADHLDIIKLPRVQIDAALTELVGCTLAETTQRGLERFLYLADYDAYYLVHSDALDARCELSGVRRTDGNDTLVGVVTLVCAGSDRTTAATLVETDGGWRVVSNLALVEHTAR